MRYFFLLLLILAAFCSKAQYSETIRTARPGQAFGSFTTGKNIFQVQSGFTFDGLNQRNSDFDSDGFSYFLALRYGLTETFELRTAAGFRRQTDSRNDSEFILDGINVWNVGVRYNIVDGGGDKASFAFQTDVRLNSVDEDYEIDEIAPRFILLHSQNISDVIGLTTNWGVRWDGISSSPEGFYVINFGFSLGEKWSTFIETYGGVINQDFTIFFDTGLAYLLNNDLQFDVSFGYGRNNGFTATFVDFGVSWRTKRKERLED